MCESCKPGQHQDGTGATGCKGCAVGHFQDASRQGTCKPCESGGWQDDEGAAQCKPCARDHMMWIPGRHIDLLARLNREGPSPCGTRFMHTVAAHLPRREVGFLFPMACPEWHARQMGRPKATTTPPFRADLMCREQDSYRPKSLRPERGR